ncbi:MAG: sulfite exporter TauE/SafE family protein [Coriobacteriales bacterium]|jgi:sulfite exporter TauE/SafE/copper chaperone CopZ|nr:sulfite exporter TauE/SafE family protein [Coriobacteriales bacterium]
MESGVTTQRLRIDGMTCVNCQKRIEQKLRSTAGVEKAEISYTAGTAVVAYDASAISLQRIVRIIESLDYQVLVEQAGQDSGRQEVNSSRVVAMVLIIVCLYMLLQHFGILNLLVPSQLASSDMGYGMLFVIGLATSVHCIAMCGGINLSQSLPRGGAGVEEKGRLTTEESSRFTTGERGLPVTQSSRRSGAEDDSQPATQKPSRFAPFLPALLYNLGRVASYTAVGCILGFVGLLLSGGSGAGLPTLLQGALKLVAGVVMVVMGINMLGLFPWLRRFSLRMPKALARTADAPTDRRRGPFLVGLLNGLMPCGPLQSLQIVALASASPLVGALSMFVFSLGTVPLMLGLGSLVSALGRRFARTVVQVGAVLVVVLGLAMLSQGGSLSGLLPPELLLPVILALGAVTVVSSLSFKAPSHKTVATVATVGLAVVVLVSWQMWGARVVADTGSSAASNGTAESAVQIVDGRQIINSTLAPGRYPDIAVEAGVPVTWHIDAPEGSINGCNNRMLIQEYGIEYAFTTGENIIEFTPATAGNVSYTCWMGMIRGNIAVSEAGSAADG